MCSMNDDPTTYDPPKAQPPRTYVLSGDRPLVRGSIALVVLGEMLNESENDLDAEADPLLWRSIGYRLAALREARDRVAKAEASYGTTDWTEAERRVAAGDR
jgi:hypothetical protein